MIRHIRIYIVGLLLMTIMSGCDNYLDRQPKSEYLAGNFYNTEAAIRQGANGVYEKVYMQFNGSIPAQTLFDMYTAMGIERQVDNSIGAGGAMATSFIWEQLWADLYTSIARAHTVLDGAKPYYDVLRAESEDTKAFRHLAEIRILRAYYYYHLINLFGDVPFFTKQVTREEWKTATRTPVDDILTFLFEDIEEAAEELPWRYKLEEDWGRVDKSFALGIKARLALNAGSICKANNEIDKANAYFRIAVDASDRIIKYSGRDLAPDYHSLFTKVGQMTADAKSENIFQLMYGGAADDAAKKTHYISWGEYSRNIGQSGRFPTQLLLDTYEMANGKRIDEPNSGYDPKKPFENRDKRLKETIYTHGSECIGTIDGSTKIKFMINVYFDKTTFYKADGSSEQRANLDRNSNVSQYGFAESGVGYLWRKYNYYDDERASAPTYNYVIMRFAEILLTYAEAKIELNEIDGTVYDAIDRVRKRVGQPTLLSVDPSRANNQDKMRQIVRRERKVELMEEGHHFYDLRRWRIGDLENEYPTYGFPVLANVDKLSLNVDSYALATPDMVPSYGEAGSRRDLNDMAVYEAYGNKLRTRDTKRYWLDAFYLSPISLAERTKAPQITNNPGYGD